MSKTTNAERCKRYREKHSSEDYKSKEALRKKHARLTLKSSMELHEEYKRKERERKRYAKLKNSFNTSPSAALTLNLQESSSTFTSSAVKSRSLKVENSLPKSPRRKKRLLNLWLQNLTYE